MLQFATFCWSARQQQECTCVSQTKGEQLLDSCKQHVVATMQSLDACRPNAEGLTNIELEKAAGLALNLAEHRGWLTWSLLMALSEEGKVEVLRRGKRRIRYFRLK
jgi:hypothetical protein